MTHYICTGGCKGKSDVPGQCQSPECKKYQKNLKECHCDDGKHSEVYDQLSDSEKEHYHVADNPNPS